MDESGEREPSLFLDIQEEDNLTVGQLCAAFENMAENYYAAVIKLDARATWTNVVFSGGAIAQSTLLQRLVTEKFGLPVRLSPT